MMQQIETYLSEEIKKALQKLNFPEVEYQFDRPKIDAHGDISVNLAMLLSKPLKKNPRQIAAEIIENLAVDPTIVERLEIAGPGFINVFLANDVLQKSVLNIIDAKERFGKSAHGSGKRVLVEFVSANPTGPLSVGHGRQAVLGDTIARLLEWMGYEVTREYYFNNAGRQMRVLGDSVRLRYLQLLGEEVEFPADYYQGEYIIDIARKIVDEYGDKLKSDSEKHLDIFKEKAETEIFADIKNTLHRLGIEFDNYFNESDLYTNGEIDKLIAFFREKDLAYDKDGAVWFRATRFGLDQDRVIVKSTGEPTYRLPDMAYHKNKFERGYDLLVDIFGSDHIATYPDVLAGVQAMGYDPGRVKVLINQFVTLYEGKEKVKMSTRRANFITVDELIDMVGVDVTRWFYLMRSMSSHLNFDIKLAKTQSDENPVYYNQYAHARICSILRNAEEQGITYSDSAAVSRLTEPAEKALIKKLMDFPTMVYKSANEYEPHLLINFLSEISTAFHKFYTECRVITDDVAVTQARLALCLATKTVLANGFKIVGVSAPERM
jgi:arginyl-tRNA synthetase